MSSVTGNLSGIRVQRQSRPGLMPLRYWYPKKLSSAQCSATYSGGTAQGRHDATHSPQGQRGRELRTGREGGRPWTTERISGGKPSSRPRVEPPEGSRAAFSEEPPEGALACANSGLGFSAAPTPRPRRGSCLPPAARAPGARSRSNPPFSFPPHTEDDRFISRENFLNVLQFLPGPFAVHQAAELEPQCPVTGEAVRNGVQGPWDGGRAAPPPAQVSRVPESGRASGPRRGPAQGRLMSGSPSVTAKVP